MLQCNIVPKKNKQMRYTKYLALMLLMTVSVANMSFAQSEDDDPLAAIDELNAALAALESFEGDTTSEETTGDTVQTDPAPAAPGSEASESTSESTSETTANEETSAEPAVAAEATTTVDEVQAKSILDRLAIKEIPAGKENHILYTMPGTIDYRGMTFLKIDSSKFFNRFQKCNVAASDTVTSALSRLKISQGAPLECRESMQYQFLPYKTFRASR